MSIQEKFESITPVQIIVVSAVLAGLYWMGVYKDGQAQQNKIAAAVKKQAILKLQLEKAIESEENAKKYKILEDELGDKLEKIVKYIPYELGDADIMSLISNSAKFVGANISSIQGSGGSNTNFSRNNNGENKNQNFLEKINIQVSLEASYSQILLFLSELTRADRIINPETVSLDIAKKSRGNDGDQTDTINFSGNFIAYRYKVDDENEDDEYLQGLPGYQQGGLLPGSQGGYVDPDFDGQVPPGGF